MLSQIASQKVLEGIKYQYFTTDAHANVSVSNKAIIFVTNNYHSFRELLGCVGAILRAFDDKK